MAPSGSRRRYSEDGSRLIASTSCSPVMSTGKVSRSTLRATVDTGTQGRRSAGVAARAASLTTPTA